MNSSDSVPSIVYHAISGWFRFDYHKMSWSMDDDISRFDDTIHKRIKNESINKCMKCLIGKNYDNLDRNFNKYGLPFDV